MTLLLLASLGCTKGGDSDSGLSDADADGFTSDVDCDDDDPAVNPDASETCDGVDDDCDDAIDEGTTIDLWPDVDGDGYGDQGSPTEGCSQGSGLVVDGSDCDDSDADVNPGATEVCNTIDDDCDGDIDDADASTDASSETTFYRDEDGDGYGYEPSTTTACEQPSGYTDNAEDCNDAIDTINPDAQEICNGIDDDCDEFIDGDDDSIDPSTVSEYYADSDGDGYGGESVLACELVSGLVENDGDCDDTNADANPGEEESCADFDANCDGDNWSGAADAWFLSDADSSWTAADLSSWTSTESGALYACTNTFDADITLEHDVDIIGLGEDSTILDGGGARTILTIETDALTVDVSGVTFLDGLATATEPVFSYYSMGGGLQCSAESTVTVSDSAFEGNSAPSPGIGGAVAVNGCDVTLDSVEVSGSSADYGAALFSFDGFIDVTDSDVFENEAIYMGGVWYGYTTGTSNVLSLDESAVYDNTAGYWGGALLLDVDAEAYCTGSTSTAAGFWNNTAGLNGGGGAVRVYSTGSYFESDTCDFGTDDAGNNNEPSDVVADTGAGDTGDTGYIGYEYGEDETFSCTPEAGCE